MSTYGNQDPPLPLKLIRGGFQTIGAFSPKLAGRLGYELFRTPLKRSPHKTKHKLMQNADKTVIPFQNGSITTFSWPNSGPTVLLIHGWESNASRWLPLLPKLLAKNFRVIAFDAPAHGKSSGRQLPFDRYAAAIDAVSQHFDPIDMIVAHSFGVVGSSYYLSQYKPASLKRVVFSSGPNLAKDVLLNFAQIVNIPSGAVPFMLDALVSDVQMPLDEIGVAHLMQNSTLPGLILHDRDDQVVPFSAGESVAASWPGVIFHPTNGLGHRRILRDPQILDSIVGFLAVNKAVHV